jgi:hypothetical protein
MAPITITSLLAGMSRQRIQDVFARDLNRAAGWVRLTALDGMAEGQLAYGRMLLDGNGVPKDVPAAFNWFQRAAAQNNIDALNMVGRCFDMGWGTPENPAAAAAFFHRAADSGHAWAQYNLGHMSVPPRAAIFGGNTTGRATCCRRVKSTKRRTGLSRPQRRALRLSKRPC